jgi:hypothetical protein
MSVGDNIVSRLSTEITGLGATGELQGEDPAETILDEIHGRGIEIPDPL